MKESKVGYWILIGALIFVALLWYAEGEKGSKLYKENERLQEQIDSLKSEIGDLEDYIRELEGDR